jgi:hypothetical protein
MAMNLPRPHSDASVIARDRHLILVSSSARRPERQKMGDAQGIKAGSTPAPTITNGGF